MVRVLANGRYVSGPSETSDSTDNEQQEKRRRFKKRYELDRNKSSSVHSIPGTAKFSQPSEQGVYGPEVEEPQVSRLKGHSEVPQSDSVCDGRTAKPSADRRDVDSSSVGRSLHSDARSSASLGHAPSSYHSLPRPPKPSQPQHSQPPQHARQDLRDGQKLRQRDTKTGERERERGSPGQGETDTAKDRGTDRDKECE